METWATVARKWLLTSRNWTRHPKVSSHLCVLTRNMSLGRVLDIKYLTSSP